MMNKSTLTREIVFSQLDSTDPFPISFDDAWKWLGFYQKSDAKDSLFSAGFVKTLDYRSFKDSTGKPQGGRPSEKIQLTIDCFKMWAMMANTAKGQEVRLWYLQVEKEWRALTTPDAGLVAKLRDRIRGLEIENQELESQVKFLSLPKPISEEEERIAMLTLKSRGFPDVAIARILKDSPENVYQYLVSLIWQEVPEWVQMFRLSTSVNWIGRDGIEFHPKSTHLAGILASPQCLPYLQSVCRRLFNCRASVVLTP